MLKSGWIVTLDVLKLFNAFAIASNSAMLNSNIRCIEMITVDLRDAKYNVE